MKEAFSDPGVYPFCGASARSSNGSGESGDSGSWGQSMSCTLALNLNRESCRILEQLKANALLGNCFHDMLTRLCHTAFNKSFGVLSPDIPVRISTVKDATESEIDQDLLQSDLLVLDPDVFDPVGDKTFPSDTQKKIMRGGEPYFVPSGWTRAGMRIGDLEKSKGWYVAFDGARFDNRNSLVRNGLLLPARILVGTGGEVLVRRHVRFVGGRVSGDSDSSLKLMRTASEEPKGWKVSQSIHYASLFSQPLGLERSYVQLLFQVLVDPSRATVKRKDALTFWDMFLPFDPNFEDSNLACTVGETGLVVAGLLFREVRNHPYTMTVERQEVVRRWMHMRFHSQTYTWMFKRKRRGSKGKDAARTGSEVGAPALSPEVQQEEKEEWMQFGPAIQQMLQAEWKEGRAVSSRFRARLEEDAPEGSLWEVLFSIPVVRRADDSSVWYTVGTMPLQTLPRQGQGQLQTQPLQPSLQQYQQQPSGETVESHASSFIQVPSPTVRPQASASTRTGIYPYDHRIPQQDQKQPMLQTPSCPRTSRPNLVAAPEDRLRGPPVPFLPAAQDLSKRTTDSAPQRMRASLPLSSKAYDTPTSQIDLSVETRTASFCLEADESVDPSDTSRRALLLKGTGGHPGSGTAAAYGSWGAPAGPFPDAQSARSGPTDSLSLPSESPSLPRGLSPL